MSKLFYKLGKTAFDKPWAFIAAWIVILGAVVALIASNGVSVSSEMKIEGTESQKVLDKLQQELPQAAGDQGSVVFTVPDGERLDTPERQQAILAAIADIYKQEYVINPADLAAAAGAQAQQGAAQGAQGAAQSGQDAAAGQGAGAQDQAAGAAQGQGAAGAAAAMPYGPLLVDGQPVPGALIASNGSVALFQFQFTVQKTSVPADVLKDIIATVEKAESGTGIDALPSDSLLMPEIPIGMNEVYGLIVAVLALLVTLGSLVAAGLPILTALIGVGIGVGGAYSISSFVPMTSFTPILALMVGLAVGIDYALFIVNRQRRLILDQGLTAREAAGRAVGTAGSAVFFAGLTVIISLCGLLVIGIAFLSTMALVASVTVLISVLVALSLLPALLGLVGERICSAKAREKSRQAAGTQKHGFAKSWVRFIIRFRWIAILLVIVALGAAALPVRDMQMGIPSGATANLDSGQRQSYDAIAKGFGEGYNGPLLLVAEPREAGGAIAPEALGKLAAELQQVKDVSIVTPMGLSEGGKMAILSIIPKSGPTDEATKDLVETLRDSDSALASGNGVTIGVTGFTAINIDMSARLAEVFPLYIGIIVLLSLLILLLVFRSILVPIKATVGFLLSVLATFGITTAIFQWGWMKDLLGFDTGGPIMSFIPILVTGILYGLAMDYQVFLVSSMRESYVHGHRGRDSVVHGYEQASRVVVAAAVIMVSVFAGFIFTHDIMIKQIGFALALGILLDAFLIRMTLVPAVMALFGDKAWSLPRWLDRILPNLDVEGDKLIAELNAAGGEREQVAKVASARKP
ncbi:MMPL family transporter [Paenibacillus albicereus]|uniref:MMPL family transporter n=1 Tax=Paenibacillus albicereus TaxID=2726185 RepID=A0A6H2GYZ5_9BACL|nr:MMPL family transporter [Paenibacillus albicereus]QJC52625.1 MMPL family transporter [Paenibacillus albicereus]